MADFVEDVGIYPTMISLATCVEAELIKSGIPVDFVTVQPGLDPVLDHVGNGKSCSEAIVNLVTAFPAGATFPAPDTGGTCGTELAYQLEVAVFRCSPQPKGKLPNLRLPTAVEQLESTRQHLADMAAVHRAIRCCFATKGSRREYAISGFAPYGPSGLVVGGVWGVVVGGTLD